MPGENILEWTIYKHSDFFIVSLSVPGSCIFLYTFERYTRPCAISHSPLETVTPSGGRERSAASEILAVVYKAFLPPWSRLVSVPLEYTPWFGNRLSAVRPSSFPYTGCLVLSKLLNLSVAQFPLLKMWTIVVLPHVVMGRIKPCKQFSRMPSWSKRYGSVSYYCVLETLSLPASSWHWGKWDPERRKKLPTRGQLRIKNWIFRPPTLISFLCPIYILTRNCKPVAHRLNILFAFFIVSFWDFPVTQTVKNLPAMQKTRVWSLGQEDPLVKGMATHSSILAWRIPWTEEPGELVRGVAKSDTTERLMLLLFHLVRMQHITISEYPIVFENWEVLRLSWQSSG